MHGPRWRASSIIGSTRLVNDPTYEWPEFWLDLQIAGITVWGAAVDTLENTSRFAKGSPTGPTTVLHLFDQPLKVARPYEGYMGNLVLPREVVDHAAEESILIDFRTPRRAGDGGDRRHLPRHRTGARSRVDPRRRLPGAPPQARCGPNGATLGAHLVEDGWTMPEHRRSGVHRIGDLRPGFLVGPFSDDTGVPHVFICDGYAASAEAMQAASLDPVFDLSTSMCIFSSEFKSADRERAPRDLSRSRSR